MIAAGESPRRSTAKEASSSRCSPSVERGGACLGFVAHARGRLRQAGEEEAATPAGQDCAGRPTHVSGALVQVGEHHVVVRRQRAELARASELRRRFAVVAELGEQVAERAAQGAIVGRGLDSLAETQHGGAGIAGGQGRAAELGGERAFGRNVAHVSSCQRQEALERRGLRGEIATTMRGVGHDPQRIAIFRVEREEASGEWLRTRGHLLACEPQEARQGIAFERLVAALLGELPQAIERVRRSRDGADLLFQLDAQLERAFRRRCDRELTQALDRLIAFAAADQHPRSLEHGSPRAPGRARAPRADRATPPLR